MVMKLRIEILIFYLHRVVEPMHGVQRRMISVVNCFIFLRLLFVALLLLYLTYCTMWKLYFTFLMC